MKRNRVDFMNGFAKWLLAEDREKAELGEVYETIVESLELLEQEDFFGTEGMNHAFGLD